MIPLNKLSRFLSLVLKHKPEEIELQLDSEGWADIDHLLERLAAHRKLTNLEALQQLSAERFTISEDGQRIRAATGHSIEIQRALEPVTPPDWLYHGTATRFLSSINNKGLNSRTSQHVHLSSDIHLAAKAGLRHGSAATLYIDAAQMHRDGYEFYHAGDDLWLTKTIPVRYLDRDS